MSRRTVLSLFESKGGLRIDEAKLSAPLIDKMEELDAKILVLEHLKKELLEVKKRRREYRILLLSSLVFAALGLAFGLGGLLEGYLGILEAAVSLLAATGIFASDYYVAMGERKLNSLSQQKSKHLDELSVNLEITLDDTYDEVLAELYPPRPLNFGKRMAGAKQSTHRRDRDPEPTP